MGSPDKVQGRREEIEARLARFRTPSALHKSAITFGLMALFAIGDFIGAALRGTLTIGITVMFLGGLCFATAAVLFWRDSRRPPKPES